MVHLGDPPPLPWGDFRVAPREDDDGAGVFPPEAPGQSAGVPVGPVGDGAAVDDEDVGGGAGWHDGKPRAGGARDDAGGVGEVRLAADRYDREAPAHSIQPPPSTSEPL